MAKQNIKMQYKSMQQLRWRNKKQIEIQNALWHDIGVEAWKVEVEALAAPVAPIPLAWIVP
jgi:hypothetical protein